MVERLFSLLCAVTGTVLLVGDCVTGAPAYRSHIGDAAIGMCVLAFGALILGWRVLRDTVGDCGGQDG